MKRQVPLTWLMAAALVVVAVVGYMALIRPKQQELGELDEQIAALESEIAIAKSAPARDKPEPQKILVADLLELAKAMPDELDMPGVLVELDTVASGSGVRLVSIQPQGQIAGEGYAKLPLLLTFEGTYYDLSDLVYRLRKLVSVRNGKLQAQGRLFALDALDFHEGKDGFPSIEAQLTLSAYMFGLSAAQAPPVAPASAPGTTPTETVTSDSEEAPGEIAPADSDAPLPIPDTPEGLGQALGGNP